LRLPPRPRDAPAPAGPLPGAKTQPRAAGGDRPVRRRRGHAGEGRLSAAEQAAPRTPAPAGRALMSAEHVVREFGGLVAVNDVSVDVPERSIVSIIGPNGAGKTTLFNILTGLYRPTSGGIAFDGKSITGRRPDQIT